MNHCSLPHELDCNFKFSSVNVWHLQPIIGLSPRDEIIRSSLYYTESGRFWKDRTSDMTSSKGFQVYSGGILDVMGLFVAY